MELLKFVFFSFLEYFSSFVFILVQFRFSVRENSGKVALISVLLSFVSYSFINADLRDVSPLVQNAIFLIYIWMVLKVNLLNSLIMLFTGYTVFGLIQTCIVAVLSHLGYITGELEIGAHITNMVAVYSSIAMFAVSTSTYLLKGGFSFVGTRGRINKKRFTRQYIGFVVYIVLAFVVTFLTNIYLLSMKHPSYLASAFVLLAVLILLFYISFKKDESVD